MNTKLDAFFRAELDASVAAEVSGDMARSSALLS